MRRRSGLHLILALPEGGTASVPATWTDLEGPAAAGANENYRRRTLGSPADLLHTRAVVDALLRPLDSSHQCPAAQEAPNAAGDLAPNPTVAPEPTSLGASEPAAASEAHRNSRATDEEGRPYGAQEGHR